MSDIIYTPPLAGGGGITINPTNNVIPLRSNATTFIDSFIAQIGNEIYTANNFGWTINYDDLFIYLGDYNNTYNGIVIKIDDTNKLIQTQSQGNDIGLKLDFVNNFYILGDYAGLTNNTQILIDDGGKNIILWAENSLALKGAGLQSASAGGSSGEHLVIYLNGTQYKIALLDP